MFLIGAFELMRKIFTFEKKYDKREVNLLAIISYLINEIHDLRYD